MNVLDMLDLIAVDNMLGHFHRTLGAHEEQFRDVAAHELADRIRTEQGLERAAAYLYATKHADSLEAARALLDRYMALLDSGRRPFETDWYRVLRDAVEGVTEEATP